MEGIDKRRIVQYKFSRLMLSAANKPSHYDLLQKKGNAYYIGDKQVVFQEDINDFITNYYENIDNPAAFRGALAIYKAISSEYIGVSRRDIEATLKNMENNQVFIPAKNVPVVRPSIPKSTGHLAADTGFVEYKQERLFTILIVIDTFSKYIAARIVNVPDTHQRFSGKSVTAAMKDILDEFGVHYNCKGQILTVKTDNGSEFVNKDFDALLQSNGIKHLRSMPHNPRSNAFAENAVKTMKVLIGKYLNSINGINIDNNTLQKIVYSYNTSYHSTIKNTPYNVQFGEDRDQREARENIKKRAIKVVDKSAIVYPTVKTGDNVRVHNRTESSWRRYTTLKKRIYEQQWSSEIFKVIRVTRAKPGVSPHYYLSLNGNNISSPFIRQDLQLIDKNKLIKNLPMGHYVVEKVIDSKIKDGITYYLVKWQGWPVIKIVGLENHHRLQIR